MKRLLFGVPALLLLLLLNPPEALAQGLKVGTGMLVVTNTSTSTPVQITNVVVGVRRVTVYGKLNARTANAGTVYIGPSSTNDSQPVEVPVNGQVVIEAAPGTYFSLSDWYLDVTVANDGVVLVFQ